jgi:hypothetical protein
LSASGLPGPSSPFVRDRNVVLIILDVIGQLIIQLVQAGIFGTPIDLARPPAQDGLMLAKGAAHSNEFVRAASDLELILCKRLIELGWRLEADT